LETIHIKEQKNDINSEGHRNTRWVLSRDTVVSCAKFTRNNSPIFTQDQKLRRAEIIRSQ